MSRDDLIEAMARSLFARGGSSWDDVGTDWHDTYRRVVVDQMPAVVEFVAAWLDDALEHPKAVDLVERWREEMGA